MRLYSAFLVAAFAIPSIVSAQATYEVTITNLTKAQSFTPVLVASHRPGASFGATGSAASSELETLAEDGNIEPLETALSILDDVIDTQSTSGLLAPGASATVTLSAERARRISVASMLVPTNDTFLFLNSVPAPRKERTAIFNVDAYDSGTEVNDELCDSVAGPAQECGGAGSNAAPTAGAEGFIHIANGIQGVGDLTESTRDWRGPVARVTVRRMKN